MDYRSHFTYRWRNEPMKTPQTLVYIIWAIGISVLLILNGLLIAYTDHIKYDTIREIHRTEVKTDSILCVITNNVVKHDSLTKQEQLFIEHINYLVREHKKNNKSIHKAILPLEKRLLNPNESIALWASVLSVIFVMFSVYGLTKVDKSLEEAKNAETTLKVAKQTIQDYNKYLHLTSTLYLDDKDHFDINEMLKVFKDNRNIIIKDVLLGYILTKKMIDIELLYQKEDRLRIVIEVLENIKENVFKTNDDKNTSHLHYGILFQLGRAYMEFYKMNVKKYTDYRNKAIDIFANLEKKLRNRENGIYEETCFYLSLLEFENNQYEEAEQFIKKIIK